MNLAWFQRIDNWNNSHGFGDARPKLKVPKLCTLWPRYLSNQELTYILLYCPVVIFLSPHTDFIIYCYFASLQRFIRLHNANYLKLWIWAKYLSSVLYNFFPFLGWCCFSYQLEKFRYHGDQHPGLVNLWIWICCL